MASVKMEDTVTTTSVTHWGFVDRLKILFFGVTMLRVEVDTEHVVGITETRSEAWTPPIFERRRAVLVEQGTATRDAG